jgi:excinuclease ABC subunit B
MQRAADEMQFEQAAEFRDRIVLLKDMDLGLKPPSRALLKTPPKPDAEKKAPGTAGGKGGRRGGAMARGRKR